MKTNMAFSRMLAIAGCITACGGDSSSDGDSFSTMSGGTMTTSASESTGGSGEDTSPETSLTTSASATVGEESGTVDTGTDTTAATTVDTSTSADESPESSDEAPATTGDVVPCDIAEATLTPVPPNIMLVLDKSGSMITNSWDHDENPNTGTVTRWYSLYQVVDFVVTTFNEQINFGANLFPSENATATYNANGCLMSNGPEIPVAPLNQDAILNGIPGANETAIYGGTPAAEGIEVARNHLVTFDPDEPRAIIFITDGAANCASDAADNYQRFEVYDEQLPVVVGDTWTNDGIPTYVVGIDISNAVSPIATDGNPDSTNTYDELETVAAAGGVPNGGPLFYQTTNQNELQAALQQIIDDALSCTVPLDPPPAFPDLLEVYIDNMMVPPAADCAADDGWIYTNPNGPYDSIELCGAWCDALKQVGSVTAEYYCDAG